MEWQCLGDDNWVFGYKVRGLVRARAGEVYYDEDKDDRRGGWVWFVAACYHPGAVPGGVTRGVAASLTEAAEAVEKMLGLIA